MHVLHAGGGGGRCRRCSGRRFGSLGRLGGDGSRDGLGGRGRALDFQHQQLVAFLEAVAQLDLQFLDDPGLGHGDFHGGLVGLQGQDALLGLDAVADLDQQFNDLAFTAEVGYANQLTHRYAP